MDRLTVLEAFVRVVELGSFSAVANELRVKQSTVSKWIAALENGDGGRLVRGNPRLTSAGRDLNPRLYGFAGRSLGPLGHRRQQREW